MKYIYIDESGDLGDKYSSSKYFVIGAIIVDNPKYLNRIIKEARKNYNNIIGRDLEVKGNKTNRYVIKKILKKVNNIDYEFWAIFLDKRNLHKIPNFYKYHELYDTLASKLAENITITSKQPSSWTDPKLNMKISACLMKDFHQVLTIPIIVKSV